MTKRRKKPAQVVLVVPAKVQDLNSVQLLHDSCFPENKRTLRWWMTKLGQEESNHACHVCKVAGTDTVIGYLLSKLSEKGYAEIVSMGVLPPYRRNGVGKLLLLHFMDEAREFVAQVHAYVPDSSEYLAAQLFLRECGFPDSRLDRKKNAIKFQRSLV